MIYSEEMIVITVVAALAAAPLAPLMQSRRWATTGVLWLLGYAVAIFGLVGPIGGRAARDAAINGYVIGLAVSCIILLIAQRSSRRELDQEGRETSLDHQ
jgi:hypothetical protein